MTQAPAPGAPPADLNINATEVPQIAEGAFAFMHINGMLLGSATPMQYDAPLTALQRMRPLLERWTDVCKKLNVPSPVVVLDELAKKQCPDLASKISMAYRCASSACLLQQTLTIVLQIAQKLSQQEVRVDADRLKKMN